MKNLPLLLLTGLLFVLVNSCKKDSNSTNSNFGYTYFPSKIGLTRVYHVDSIFWDAFTHVHDTVSYELKEILDSTYLDNQQRPTQRIERFKKDSIGNWVIYKVWASNLTSTTAEQVEDNLRFVKIVFKPALNSTWNGNSLNTLDPQIYRINSLNNPESLGALSFDSTMTVMHEYTDTLVNKLSGIEKYATGVGLYYRQSSDLHYIFPTGTIKSGYIYTETLTSYTKTP